MEFEIDRDELRRITDICLNQKAVKKEIENNYYTFLAGMGLIAASDNIDDLGIVMNNMKDMSSKDMIRFAAYLLALSNLTCELIEKYGFNKERKSE